MILNPNYFLQMYYIWETSRNKLNVNFFLQILGLSKNFLDHYLEQIFFLKVGQNDFEKKQNIPLHPTSIPLNYTALKSMIKFP